MNIKSIRNAWFVRTDMPPSTAASCCEHLTIFFPPLSCGSAVRNAMLACKWLFLVHISFVLNAVVRESETSKGWQAACFVVLSFLFSFSFLCLYCTECRLFGAPLVRTDRVTFYCTRIIWKFPNHARAAASFFIIEVSLFQGKFTLYETIEGLILLLITSIVAVKLLYRL
jgi:hypothetical protein